MQNHGGYKDTYEGFETDTVMTNGNFPDVNQYLSVAHQTDLAVEKLIEYFETVDDKVVICFFGDHQPSLDGTPETELYGKTLDESSLDEIQMRYEVPYLIWANYDAGTQANTLDTSLNSIRRSPFPPST